MLIKKVTKEHLSLKDRARSEFLRKALHFLICLAPLMAHRFFVVTIAFLVAGTAFYFYVETLRLAGIKIPIVSRLTDIASRPRDRGRIVLGPVTLGVGALLALILFRPPICDIAIFALALGDGLAGLVGRLVGKHRPAILCGKSVEGSASCFIAVYIVTYFVTKNYSWAALAAASATVVEALPLDDIDNILIPLAVGLTLRYIA
jgi:dolichol kinase